MLEFKNVSKSFEKEVIKNLSFVLNEGEKILIWGESGIGKTTIVNLILGIIEPDSGEIINKFKKISTVFQENRLVEEISAIDNLKLVSEKDDFYLKNILKDLKIENPEEIIKNLSGGMKRRVSIARALIFDADLYIFDEPIQGLDDLTRKIVIEKILELTRKKTLILISHDEEDVRDFEIDKKYFLE